MRDKVPVAQFNGGLCFAGVIFGRNHTRFKRPGTSQESLC